MVLILQQKRGVKLSTQMSKEVRFANILKLIVWSIFHLMILVGAIGDDRHYALESFRQETIS